MLVKSDPDVLALVALSTHAKAMAEDMYKRLMNLADLRDRDGGGEPGDQRPSRPPSCAA